MNPGSESFIFLQIYSCGERYLRVDNLCYEFIDHLNLHQYKSLLQEYHIVDQDLKMRRKDRCPIYERIPSDQRDIIIRYEGVNQKEFPFSLLNF